MRYLLDTNILSNITKPAPSEPLIAWMADQADQDLFIASLTIAEIWRGVLEKPAGKRQALNKITVPEYDFSFFNKLLRFLHGMCNRYLVIRCGLLQALQM